MSGARRGSVGDMDRARVLHLVEIQLRTDSELQRQYPFPLENKIPPESVPRGRAHDTNAYHKANNFEWS